MSADFTATVKYAGQALAIFGGLHLGLGLWKVFRL
jgi:hypothetical protein